MARQPLAESLHDPQWQDALYTPHLLPAPVVRQLLHQERLCFLMFLRNSDFPSLLAWRLPALAQRLFAKPCATDEYKFVKQAARTCFGYAVASLPRLTPRQAWVGQGFGSLAIGESLALVQQERLHIEPDIHWFVQQLPILQTVPLQAGEDAWQWVRRACQACHLPTLADGLSAMQAAAQTVGLDNFAKTLHWQAVWRDSLHALGLPAATGSGYWVSRLAAQPVALPKAAFALPLAAANRAFMTPVATTPLLKQSSPIPMPLVLRVAHHHPSDVWCQAEEFWDWVLDSRSTEQATQGGSWQSVAASALMVAFHDGRVRLLGFDPSPARSASRAVRLSPYPVDFLANRVLKPLRLPDGLLDNRAIRPAVREYQLHELDVGDEAEIPSPLMGQAVAGLWARELASPRYAVAPDILPQYRPFHAGVVLPFGRLDASGTAVLLEPDTFPALRKQTRDGLGLARWLLNLNPLFLQVAWLDLLLEGKKACLYTGSGLGFDWLFSRLQHLQQPVYIQIPQGQLGASPLVDAAGHPLDALVMIKASDESGFGSLIQP